MNLLHDYELVGVSRAEAAELLKARRQFTAEQGYIEGESGSMGASPTRKCQKSGSKRDARIL